jgi:hypothetical protein
MPYIVTKSSGQTLTTIADDTVDTTATSLSLVGKNYAGYGIFLNENFVKLIENFSSSVGPTSPMVGQLWYDSANTLLKIWVGNTWKQIHTSVASATAPEDEIVGDLWWDIVNLQLKIWSGSTWILIGPGGGSSISTSSGAIVDTIIDTPTNNSHLVVRLIISGTTVAMVSKDAAFTPASAISGFPTIYPGITLVNNISGTFAGTANNASYFNSLISSQFLRSDINASTTGTLSILNNAGLNITSNLNIGMGTTSTNLTNNYLGNDFNIYVNKGGSSTIALGLSGGSGNITTGKWNGTIIEPTFGGTGINNGTNRLTLSGSYTLNQDVSTTGAPAYTGLTLSGAPIPNANVSANIGSTSRWWGNVYAANYYGKFNGDGSGLTNLSAGALSSIPNSALLNSSLTINGTSIALGGSGTVTAAAGTLTGATLNSGVTASSLTSVGILTGLTVQGDLVPNANAAINLGGPGTQFWNNVYAAKFYGAHYGDGSNLTNVPASGVTGGSITINGTSIALGGSGTVTAAAGTLTGTTLNSGVTASSLTSVGILTNLNVSGNILASTANIGQLRISTNITAGGFINAAGNVMAVTFTGVSTTAKYADLAEKYLSDQEYPAGTVVTVGGTAEVTAATYGQVAIGVVSTNPAYLMNSDSTGQAIALKGRVPVKVNAAVKKGDRLAPAQNQFGVAELTPDPTYYFAIALEDSPNPSGIRLVECIIL